jgi:hypothetical protein
MDKVQMLFVRACKSKNPAVRVLSVYRRFYCRCDDQRMIDFAVSSLLIDICDKNNIVTLSRVFSDLYPDDLISERKLDSSNYWSSVRKLVTSYIRWSNIDEFSDFIIPLRYRYDV